ncbi:MAG: amidohydrolase family protein [bacterium]|nr:amidohydrolase family protein [bacterium]
MIIKNAVLINMNDIYREKVDLVVRDGKIAGFSSDIEGECGEMVLDAAGAIVTPGFVEADCLAGTRSQVYRKDNNDADDAAAISPELRALDTLDFSDEAFVMARKGGVTTVVSSPGKSALIGGTCAAVKTGGCGYEDRILKGEAAYQFSLTSEPRKRFGAKGTSPMTRMGSAAMIRSALGQALSYHEECREKETISHRLNMMALSRVFDGMPVKIAANRSQDIMTAVRIGEEYGLNYIITGAYDAALACKNLERENLRFLIGPLYGGGKSREEENRSLSLGSQLEKQRISFAITTGHPSMNLELFPCQLSLLVNAGMSEKEALQAATILPAKLLGLADRIGSIEPGKDADIVIWNGEPLDFYGSVRTMIINGTITEL